MLEVYLYSFYVLLLFCVVDGIIQFSEPQKAIILLPILW